VLVDPSELRLWNVCGLPRDPVSTDNMIIATRASRWPLMIDPQGQANEWIKALEANNSLKTCRGTDPVDDLTDAIIDAVRLGGAILIEGLDEQISSALIPALENVTFFRVTRFKHKSLHSKMLPRHYSLQSYLENQRNPIILSPLSCEISLNPERNL